jgi:hypothetical protein
MNDTKSCILAGKVKRSGIQPMKSHQSTIYLDRIQTINKKVIKLLLVP